MRRDDRVAQVLQEQEHHQEHQRHRLEQRLDHLRDRDAHEARAVVRDGVLHALREELRQLVHARAHRVGRGQRVAGGRQLHADAGGRLAVQARRRWRSSARRARCGPRRAGARWSRRGWRAARCCRTARPWRAGR